MSRSYKQESRPMVEATPNGPAKTSLRALQT